MTPDNKKDKPTPLLKQSIEAERKNSSEPETMNFLIETIPESGGHKSPIKTSTPIAKQKPIQHIILEEEVHNTLDFDKYVLVDPNTGDIAVIRNPTHEI